MRRPTTRGRAEGDVAIRPAETEVARRGRLVAADLLRALATVLVVVIHTTHWPYQAAVYDAFETVSRLAVPAFMMLTGVLLSYRYGKEEVSPAQFLKRRFSRSLLPWVVWAPLYAVTGWFYTGNVPHSAGDLVTFFSYGAGHLWFLLLIPQMYLLFLVWPRRRLWLWAALAVLFQVGLSVYRLYGPMPVSILEQLTLWHGFQLLPFWVGYFAVGLAAGRTLAERGAPDVVQWRAVLAATVAVAASGWLLFALKYSGAPHDGFQQGTGGFLLPQEPLFVVSVAALVLVIAPLTRGRRAVNAVITVLSDNSLGVYIFHPIIVYPIAKQMYSALLAQGLPLSMVGFVVLTVVAIIASTLLSVLISMTPLAPVIGAARRPFRALPTAVRRRTPTAG